jgi:DNA end-binding protein Ku
LDLSRFEDGYEVAVRELVDAKLKHLPVPKDEMPQPSRSNVVSLMDALRKSIDSGMSERPAKKPVASAKAETKKGIGLVKPPARVSKRKSA